MGDPSGEFANLMTRVRAGDREALEELCHRYGGHIRRAVRHKLDKRLRPRFDSLDFSQDVWASFVAVPLADYTFQTPEQLIKHLAGIARHKVTDAWREHLGTDKRNRHQELPLDGSLAKKIPTRQPTPSQFAVADERWEKLLVGLTPSQRQVVELLRQGYLYEEIANRLNVHPKAIQRLVNKLAERLES